MYCNDIFEIVDQQDKFCCKRCKEEYIAKLEFNRNSLRMRKSLKKFSRQDAVQLDYLDTLEVELVGN